MFRDSLTRTRQAVFGRIASLLGASELGDSSWDELEELLVQADIGVNGALHIVERLKRRVLSDGLTTQQQLTSALKELLEDLIAPDHQVRELFPGERLLTVIMVVGVNGAGKTTTIGKLCTYFRQRNWRVMLAGADTYRAAASEQLLAWAERNDVPAIVGQANADPGAVAYDAIRAARARERDLLIVDTAGRLHTKLNLMEELKKIRKVIAKNVHDGPHEVWLVLDGTAGQNAISQARHFKDAVGVTGLIITKLDSSARGGSVIGISHELKLPVRFIGVGEGVEDLKPFVGEEFVSALLSV